jgi:hypothetical protein
MPYPQRSARLTREEATASRPRPSRADRGRALVLAGWAADIALSRFRLATARVDLSLLHLVEGLCYAYPRRMATLAVSIPLTLALRERVTALPELAAYFASGRRLAFSEERLFRHYPEADRP